jgi:hypothetical protein
MGKEQLLFENAGKYVSLNGSILSAAEFAGIEAGDGDGGSGGGAGRGARARTT